MEGTVIDGKYEVIRPLGQGGMGTVYEARHRATGRKVAVKVIVPSALAAGADIIARFQREARASGSIDSPHVVQVLDAGIDAQTNAPYMAMECLSGEDVQVTVTRLGALAPEVALAICAQACHGLQKAHEGGIVHRDIKSANLFLARRDDDSGELVTKILDFGIAKVRASPLGASEDHKLTKTGSMLGSPVYMSPEQAIGSKDLDARSDIFSMGVMLYEALSGATPNGHVENLGALVMAICAKDATLIQERAPWISPEIARVVHKAIAREPGDRYQTAAEFRAAILALLPESQRRVTEAMLVSVTPDRKAKIAERVTTNASLALADTAVPQSTDASLALASTMAAGDAPDASSGNVRVASAITSTPPPRLHTTTAASASEVEPRPLEKTTRSPAIVAILAIVGIGAAAVGVKGFMGPPATNPTSATHATPSAPLPEPTIDRSTSEFASATVSASPVVAQIASSIASASSAPRGAPKKPGVLPHASSSAHPVASASATVPVTKPTTDVERTFQ